MQSKNQFPSLSLKQPGACQDSHALQSRNSCSKLVPQDEVGDLTVRTLAVELVGDSSASVDEVSNLCRSFGGVHALTHKDVDGGKVVLVTFEDARDCQRARAALSHIPQVSKVKETVSQDDEHSVSGLVLAIKQIEEGEDGVCIASIKRMLSIFGSVASGHEVRNSISDKKKLAVFEFHSILEASQAVAAIGERPGSSFSLKRLNSDGSVAKPTQPAETRLQVASCTDESSQPSSNAEPQYPGSASFQAEDFHESCSASHPMCHDIPRTTVFPSVSYSSSHCALHTQAHIPPPTVKWHNAPNLHMLANATATPTAPRRTADFLTTFDPSEAAAGGVRARTTTMIRNIPCRWTAEDLLAVLSHVIDGRWDLLYMPCKNNALANAGYAFMNFRTSQDTLRLYNAIHGQQWPRTRSGKICEIRYARIQGRQLLSHLNSSGPAGASVFQGYLAYPSEGSVVIHGPLNAQPPAPRPFMPPHMPMQPLSADPLISGPPPAVPAASRMHAMHTRAGPPYSSPSSAAPCSEAIMPPSTDQWQALASAYMMQSQAPPTPGPPLPQASCMQMTSPASAEGYDGNAYHLQCMLQSLMHSLPQS